MHSLCLVYLKQEISLLKLWDARVSPGSLSNGMEEQSGMEDGEGEYCEGDHPAPISIIHRGERERREDVHSVKNEELILFSH